MKNLMIKMFHKRTEKNYTSSSYKQLINLRLMLWVVKEIMRFFPQNLS